MGRLVRGRVGNVRGAIRLLASLQGMCFGVGVCCFGAREGVVR